MIRMGRDQRQEDKLIMMTSLTILLMKKEKVKEKEKVMIVAQHHEKLIMGTALAQRIKVLTISLPQYLHFVMSTELKVQIEVRT